MLRLLLCLGGRSCCLLLLLLLHDCGLCGRQLGKGGAHGRHRICRLLLGGFQRRCGALRDVVEPLPEADDGRSLLSQCGLDAIHHLDHVSRSGCHGCNQKFSSRTFSKPRSATT